MKQFITFLIGILIIILGGLGEIYYIDKSSNYYRSDIEYIKNVIQNDNFKAAKEQFDRTFDTWENQKYIWDIFVYHEEVDDISQNLLELKHNINIENKEDALLSIEKTYDSLDHTAKRQHLKIENVL